MSSNEDFNSSSDKNEDESYNESFVSAENSVVEDQSAESSVRSEIPETNNSSDSDEESFIGVKKKSTRVIQDDDDDLTDEEDNRRKTLAAQSDSEADEYEERAFSRKTRMSMGYMEKHSSDDESEDDEESLISDNPDPDPDSNVEDSQSGNGFLDDEAEQGVPETSSYSAYSEISSKVSGTSTPSKSKTTDNKENASNILETSSISHDPDDFERSGSILSEVNFDKSISSKLSSTTTAGIRDYKNFKTDSPKISTIQENSVEVADSGKDVFEISDSDTSVVDLTGIPEVPASAIKKIKESVSRSFYESEVRKLGDLRSTYQTILNLYKTTRHNTHDKGVRLKARVEQLEREVQSKENELKKYEVDENKSLKNVIKSSFHNESQERKQDKSVEEIAWDAVNKASDVQPKFTGKIGMKNFETQKMLTVEKLKTIQESLETCPDENVLATQPRHLKVELMRHQLHALAWLLWREGQKPRGGILADDMGLGKTLSMISLILASEQNDEEKEDEEEEDSDDDDVVDEEEWKSKGRRDYYDGGTLVICPASLLKQWESEILNRVKRNVLSINLHHGPSREYKARKLAKYDVVITTYTTIMSEKKNDGCIFGVKWKRIICDEAHTIRNHKSKTSEAVFALRGKFRWALTGTPIQNKEFDLYAVVKFLRCSPFDDLAYWKTWIDNKNTVGGIARLNTLMKSLMLRRTKVELMEKGQVNSLPEKKLLQIDLKLSKEEMNVYSKIMSYSRTLFAQFLHQRAEKNIDLQMRFRNEMRDPQNEIYKLHKKFSTMHGTGEIKAHEILMLLLRLRQICCHPGLIETMLENHENLEGEDVPENTSELDLLAQLQNMNIDGGDDAEGSYEERVNKASAHVLRKDNPVFDFSLPSSKIQRLIDLIREKIVPTSDKAVIVSQWTTYLEIVKDHLKAEGIRCCEINGKIPVKDRNDIVESFNKEGSGPRIMLLSLTAGGVGLNLVGGNHLVLLDLHWNPQLESQAQDRIYRFGQKKPVFVYKFVCLDTIEERILMLQQKKMEISSRILTGRATATKLTMDDLRGLFEL